MKSIAIDKSLTNADWPKQTWDLPPYRSAEFLQLFPDIEHFKTLPVYKNAVASGLIHDDEWVGDWVTKS